MSTIKLSTSGTPNVPFVDPILKPLAAATESKGSGSAVSWEGGERRSIPAPPVNVVDNSWLGGLNLNDSFATLKSGFAGLVTSLLDKLASGFSGGWEKPGALPPVITPSVNPQPTSTTLAPISPPVTGGTAQTFKERVSAMLINHKNLGSVSEADLQTAMIAYQLYQKDPSFESLFLTGVQEAKSRGVAAVEANKISLIATEGSSSGKLTRSDAEWVYRLTYRGAQLDTDHASLSGAGALPLDQVLQIAEVNLASIGSGAIVPDARALY